MTKLNDKNLLRKMRVEIDTALIPVTESLGLKRIRCGTIRYEPDGLSCKITVVAEAEVEAGQPNREEKEWNDMAEFMGMSKDALHKVVTLNGRKVEIVGLNLRRRRYPVMVKEVDTGKGYFTTTDCVTRQFPKFPTTVEGRLTQVAPPERSK